MPRKTSAATAKKLTAAQRRAAIRRIVLTHSGQISTEIVEEGLVTNVQASRILSVVPVILSIIETAVLLSPQQQSAIVNAVLAGSPTLRVAYLGTVK